MPPSSFRTFAAGPLQDKENAAAGGQTARKAASLSTRAPSSSSSAAAAAFSAAATGGFTSTAKGVRPNLGRDTGPITLRLGQPDAVPLLRFGAVSVGASCTLPVRLENDTPFTRTVRFGGVPREDGFSIDPDAVLALPPGAHELVRVSWCPVKASRAVYCGTMHVMLDDEGADGENDEGVCARTDRNGTILKVRIRASSATEGEPAARAPGGVSAARRAPTTSHGRRAASILRPLSGNALVLRSDDIFEACETPGKRRTLPEDRSDEDGTPGKRMKRAEKRGNDDAVDRAAGVSSRARPAAKNAARVSLALSRPATDRVHRYTASRRVHSPSRRVVPVGKTLSLHRHRPAPGQTEEAPAQSDPPLILDDPRLDESEGGATGTFHHAQFWVSQQERALGAWLNMTLLPGLSGVSGTAASLARARRRRDAARHARARLWSLYSNDLEVRHVITRVERHVDEGRLRLRGAGGGSFVEDVRLRDEFKKALGSYSLFWLRAAVDTVVGTTHGAGDDFMAAGTHAKRSAAAADKAEQAALVAALMRDRSLEMDYGTGGDGLPPFRDGYAAALSGVILKRTLLLAFLLDRAQAGLSPDTPLLFRTAPSHVNAGFKSSAAVVRAALQASCHGEGDVLRHLGHMGYKLYHAQEPIREYDFTCTNLAVDLRDGVRLCRLVEVLSERSGDLSVMRAARFPADGRATRLHNVGAALNAARDCGVELPASWSHVTPADIVDGHLDNTLGLLWSLMMHFQGPRMLPRAELDRETLTWRDRRRAQIASGRGTFTFHGDTLAPAARAEPPVVSNDEEAEAREEERRLETLFELELFDADPEFFHSPAEAEADHADHEARLLRWARAVCANFGVEVTDNLGASFADGRALCALVHAYAPNMLPLRFVSVTPTTIACPTAPAAWRGVDHGYLLSSEPVDSVDPEALAARERHVAACESNFALAAAACRRLGGVPELTWRPVDVAASGGPDAKAVAGYLLFLCARLLSHRREETAAVTLQRHWRWRRWKPTLHRWTAAATIIAARFRGWKARRRAAARAVGIARVQARWRGMTARRAFKRHVAAAVTCQRHVRGWIARERFLDVRCVNVILQAYVRGGNQRRRFLRLRRAVITAQRFRRGKAQREHYVVLRTAATSLQAAWRGRARRVAFLRLRKAATTLQAMARQAAAARLRDAMLAECARVRATEAATTIQACARGFLARRIVFERRRVMATAATAVQARWRGMTARRAFKRHVAAAVTCQRHVRGWIARERFLDVRCVNVILQAYVRGGNQRRRFLRLRRAVITAQRFRRGKIQRERHVAAVESFKVLQARVRGNQIRRRAAQAARAATTIQAAWRGRRQRVAYLALRDAAVTAQAHHRGAAKRSEYLRWVRAAVIVQKHVRAHLARTRYALVRHLARLVQSWVRTRRQRAAFLDARAAVVVIQREWRCASQRRAFLAARAAAFERHVAAAVTCQRHVRGWIARERFLDVRCVNVILQAYVRGGNQRRRFLRLRRAVITAQRFRRGKIQRERHVAAVESFKVLQARVRGNQIRRRAAQAARAATAIQAAWRGRRQRVAYLALRDARLRVIAAERHVAAAVTCQSLRRAAVARRRFLHARRLVVATQARLRAALLRRRFLSMRAAAVTIQSRFRGWLRRVDYALVYWAAGVVQAHYRGRVVRRRFLALRHAATMCQVIFRGATSRGAFEALRATAVELQARARGAAARRGYLRHRRAATAIAAAARGAIARRHFVGSRRAATCVQRFARGWLVRRHVARAVDAAHSIQASVRRWLGEVRRRRDCAAVMVQARWRGHAARRSVAEVMGPRLGELRALVSRSLNAARADPSRTLGARAAAAVAVLQNGPRRLREVRDALRDLAVATKWSAECRRKAADQRALQAMLRTVRQCDRSDAHEPVLAAAYALFENLSADQDGPAGALFSSRDSVNIITEHMQMCRDRPELVAAAVRTVVNLCRDEGRAAEVARMGKIPSRIRSIAEIMSNNLDVHRHRRLTYIEQARPDKAREEAASMNILERSIRSMRSLIDHLEPFCVAAREGSGSSARTPGGTAAKPPRSALLYPSSRAKSRLSLGGFSRAEGKENTTPRDER